MKCHICKGDTKKFGKDRKGQQRYRCLECKKTFIEPHIRPLGNMTLAEDKVLSVMQHLVEGCSIRSTERITGVHRDTILCVLQKAGDKCDALMKRHIHGVRVTDVQCDEQWQYIGMKSRTKARKGLTDDQVGDSWVFTAIDRHSKLILAWHLGSRTMEDTIEFTDKLAYATEGCYDFQVTTDGFIPYRDAVVMSLGVQHINFAQLVKRYANNPDTETRYSPAVCTGTTKKVIFGDPDMAQVSTSHVERHNLSTRMQMRRYTRLTNGFSKKWEKHYAALALWLAYYNFCRIHRSLRCTPAMEAGTTDHVWTLEELIRN
jgi:transposase-like protein/IS1 family transposase